MLEVIGFVIIIIMSYILSEKFSLFDKVSKNTYKKKFIEMSNMTKDSHNIEIKNNTNKSDYKDDEEEMNYDEWTPLSLS